MYSGKDGSILFRLSGSMAGDVFGRGLSGIGDVNRDGHPDFAIGAGQMTYSGKGYVRAFSGKDGSPLFTIEGDTADDMFGVAVRGCGDVDGDGGPDLIVGAPQVKSRGHGYARVHSGRDGRTLYTFLGDTTEDRFGAAVSGAGDVNGDGHADLLVGAPGDDDGGADAGSVRLFSGKDGKALRTFTGNAAQDFLGASVGSMPGSPPWLLLGAPQYHETGKGYALVVRDGKTVLTLTGSSAHDHLGFVDAAGDVDGNGTPAVLVAAAQYDPARMLPFGPGFVSAYSTAPRSLASDTHTLSLSAGGAQTFRMEAGSEQGGRYCLLLGTMSGTQVQWNLGPVTLPLNPFDSYFGLSLAHPNHLIANQFGVMAASGHGTAQLALPAGMPPALAGIVLHHAYVVFRADPPRFDFASNAVPLILVQ